MGNTKRPAVVGNRGEYVALRAARQRDRDARQDPALRILDWFPKPMRSSSAPDSIVGMGSKHGGHEGKTNHSLEASQQGHRLSSFLLVTVV